MVRVVVLSAGGAFGVNARYWLGVWMSRWAGPQFPWATFAINVSGSFAMGFLSTILARWMPHPHLRLLVLVGFLGGYTTFSAFTFESLTLLERGEGGPAAVNLLGSVMAGFAAVALGVSAARALILPRAERAGRGDLRVLEARVPTATPARGRPASPGDRADGSSEGAP